MKVESQFNPQIKVVPVSVAQKYGDIKRSASVMAELNSTQHMKKQELLNTHSHVLYKKSSSIESIHKSRYKKHDQFCPLSIIKHHQRNFMQDTHKRLQQKNQKKRNAYKFFEQQRMRRMEIEKHETYLLPKLSRKDKNDSKINGQQSTGQSNQPSHKKKTQSNVLTNQNVLSLKKLKNRFKCQQLSDISNEMKQKISIFKDKCAQEMNQIGLSLSKTHEKKKCFFDVSREQLEQVYRKQSSSDLDSYNPQNSIQASTKTNELIVQNEMIAQKCKFKLINLKDDQKDTQNNSNIPNFLIQRLNLHPKNPITPNFFLQRLNPNTKKQRMSDKNSSFITQSSLLDMLVSPSKKQNLNMFCYKAQNKIR